MDALPEKFVKEWHRIGGLIGGRVMAHHESIGYVDHPLGGNFAKVCRGVVYPRVVVGGCLF